MGGFHIAYRRTHDCIYNAVKGEIQLPKELEADKIKENRKDKNICPEFFFGMYKDVYKGKDNNGQDIYYRYGLDAGIVFFPGKEANQSGEFRLTINMFPITSGEYGLIEKDGKTEYGPKIWFELPVRTVRPGDRVYLQVYLMHNSIYILAQNPDNKRDIFGRLSAKLSDGAYKALNSGSFINREIVMASNLYNNKYAPSRAYFTNATWRKTKITNATTHEVIHLTEYNSYLRNPYDDGEKYLHKKRPQGFKYHRSYPVTEPGDDGLGNFVADVANGDCRP